MRATYLVVYDIRHPARLQQVAKIAKDYGLRVQKSVFEAEMNLSELNTMKARMKKVIDPEKDGIKIFRLCQSCEARRTGAGIVCPQLPHTGWHIF